MSGKYYRVWEYELMVWKKAILDTISFYATNKMAWIGNLVGIAATLYAVFVMQGSQAMYNELLLLSAGLIGFVVTGIFYVLVFRMSAPLVLYRKKESEANIWTWKDVEVKPFLLPKTSGFGVGLEVISYKSNYKYYDNYYIEPLISGVRVILRDVLVAGEEQRYPEDNSSLLRLLEGNKTFERTSNIKCQEQFARDKQPLTAISIANWNENEAWITIGTNPQQKVFLEEKITYSIHLQITGEIIDFPPMSIFHVFCDLLYHNDSNEKKFRLH